MQKIKDQIDPLLKPEPVKRGKLDFDNDKWVDSYEKSLKDLAKKEKNLPYYPPINQPKWQSYPPPIAPGPDDWPWTGKPIITWSSPPTVCGDG